MPLGLIMQNYLSLDSDNIQIMIPLLIRGVGMGMIIAPLSTLAMTRITPQNFAQASGLFNVIRQVGGSFGVAVMGTILSHQMIIHSANYSQGVTGILPLSSILFWL